MKFLDEDDDEAALKDDNLEQCSAGRESCCTSVGTQTPSIQDANIQTTPSLESSISEITNEKFHQLSRTRIRNLKNYNRLDSSTKVSSFESSVRDESTQCKKS